MSSEGPASARDSRPPEEHLRQQRRTGDGWVETPQGRFWGLFGAAGLLIHDPDRGVLLQHRAVWSAQGGTWGIPGGALDESETPKQGAIRECWEETGVPGPNGEGITVIGEYRVDKDGWAYTTVITQVTQRLEANVADAESIELRWVPLDEVAGYELHPGFAAAWPELLQVLRQHAAE